MAQSHVERYCADSAATAIVATGLERVGSTLANVDQQITLFRYRAPQSALDDLKRRLAQTRWPERETVVDWTQGVPFAKLKALVEYWRTTYDWRGFETKLNGFAHYRTEIDGLNIWVRESSFRKGKPTLLHFFCVLT